MRPGRRDLTGQALRGVQCYPESYNLAIKYTIVERYSAYREGRSTFYVGERNETDLSALRTNG